MNIPVSPLYFCGAAVVVIGGSSGIGLGIARRFADFGGAVTITGTRRSAADYDNAVGLDGLGYEQLDVTDDRGVAAFASSIEDCRVLVGSQGTVVYGRGEYDMDTFRRVLEVNLTGTMSCCQRFRPALSRSAGSVVLIGSTSSFIATPGQPAYGASKGGLRSLVASLARAWAGDDIRVNAIAPGFETKLTTVTRERPAAYEATIAKIPLARWENRPRWAMPPSSSPLPWRPTSPVRCSWLTEA